MALIAAPMAIHQNAAFDYSSPIASKMSGPLRALPAGTFLRTSGRVRKVRTASRTHRR